MKRIRSYFIIICLLTAAMGGCRSAHYSELMLLKRFGQNRQKIEKYLDQQERLFEKLNADVADHRLSEGTTKGAIVSAYGEPLLCKHAGENGAGGQRCIYRRPTGSFFTDMIYLTFDDDQKLVSSELKEARE